jgi:hypothetical protein
VFETLLCGQRTIGQISQLLPRYRISTSWKLNRRVSEVAPIVLSKQSCDNARACVCIILSNIDRTRWRRPSRRNKSGKPYLREPATAAVSKKRDKGILQLMKKYRRRGLAHQRDRGRDPSLFEDSTEYSVGRGDAFRATRRNCVVNAQGSVR